MSVPLRNVFITGSSRGIGLELARQMAQSGSFRVFAAARSIEEGSPLHVLSQELKGSLIPIPSVDVTDDASIEAAVKAVSEHVSSLDLLINNAGVMGKRGSLLGEESADRAPDRESIRNEFEINATSPCFVAKAFLPLLESSQGTPVILNTSSTLGSISRNGAGGMLGYRMSKAALNMATKCMSVEAKGPLIAVAIHPGWVVTDMGGSSADIDVATSAAGILRVLDGLSLEDSGKFYSFNGEELQW